MKFDVRQIAILGWEMIKITAFELSNVRHLQETSDMSDVHSRRLSQLETMYVLTLKTLF